MKFPTSLCPNLRTTPTFEEFLLANNDTHDTGINAGNDNNNERKSDSRPADAAKSTERQHISRRWCYITQDEHSDNNPYHRVIYEAPFVRMKEIHISPPRLPIREDSKKIRLAESKKEEGNKYYKQKKYQEALKFYTGAIDLCPTVASYYGNRCACLMMVGKYKEALDDAKKAVKLDETFVKGFLRESKCYMMLGDITAALRSLENVKLLDPNNASFIQDKKTLELLKRHLEESDKYYNKKDYRSALFNIERCLSIASECVRFKVMKAEFLVFLSRNQEAQEIVNDIIRSDPMNADALYIRGMSLYYQDNVEKAFAHFQQVLKYSPDHIKAKEIYRKAKLLMAKKQEGNEAFKNNKLQEAFDIYTSALTIDPLNSLTNAKLYFNRAVVSAKRNKVTEALEDCSSAINLDPHYIKAYLKRAKLYMDSEMFEEAVRDYETILKKEKTREHKQLLENAKLELKKSKRKDYYKILGVARNAGDDEIKKAYRKRAMIHHPDRHSNASETEKKEQEKKFKELGEAYAVLSDPKKRSRYDSGVDFDGSSADGFADIDPNNIFQAFWSNGHGSSGFGGANHGPFHFTFNQQGHQSHGNAGFSFPNFHFQ